MNNNNTEAKQGVLLRRVYSTLIKYIWLVLLIVVGFTAIGFGISYTKKPIYKATNKTVFMVEEKAGKTTAGTNYTNQYFITAIDYIQQGIVADRADYYYKAFKTQTIDSTLSLDSFISMFGVVDIYSNPEANNFYNRYKAQLTTDNKDLNTFASEVMAVEVFSQDKTDAYLTAFAHIADVITNAGGANKVTNQFLLDELDKAIKDYVVANSSTVVFDREEIETLYGLYQKFYLAENSLDANLFIYGDSSLHIDGLYFKDVLSSDSDKMVSYKEYVKKLDSYITAEKEQVFYDVLDYIKTVEESYVSGVTKGDGAIVSTQVTTGAADSKSLGNFAINVSYTDPNYTAAIEKSKLVILAAEREAKFTSYFGSWRFVLTDLGLVSAGNIVTRAKEVFTAGILGVLTALVVVYAITLLDRTITEKEELEAITGADLLAYISNGGK